MGLFNKKPDPISDRARALNAEIAALEAKIKKLDQQLHTSQQPRVRSTVFPHGSTITASSQPVPYSNPVKPAEPVFEEVDQNKLKAATETLTTPQHFNEMGVRKYDLPALIQRVKKHFSSQATSNPKLVSYLASGSVQGLRPLRYEKRVARNRFIALAIVFVLVLLGIFAALVKHH